MENLLSKVNSRNNNLYLFKKISFCCSSYIAVVYRNNISVASSFSHCVRGFSLKRASHIL